MQKNTTETKDRRVPGLDGSAAAEAMAAIQAPFCKIRIFDVLMRRVERVKREADEAWEEWKRERENIPALHRYVRRVKRCARLKEAAMMDLDERALRLLGEMEGRAA